MSTNPVSNPVNDPPDALNFYLHRFDFGSLRDKSFEDFYAPLEVSDEGILLLTLLGKCCYLDLKKFYDIDSYPHSCSAATLLTTHVSADRSGKADDDCDDGFYAHSLSLYRLCDSAHNHCQVSS